MNREERKAWALAYLAMLSYSVPVGFTFMAVKTGVGQGGSLQLLTFRFTSAFLGALLLQAAGRIRWDRAALPRRDLAITALSYVGFLGFQAFGLLYTTSIVSGILFAAVPVFARLIGGVVLKERSTRIQNLFAALSVGAVMAMFAIGAGDGLRSVSLPGFGLLLVSSLSCALSNVYMRRVRQSCSPLTVSYFCCGTGCVIFWGLSLASGALKEGLGAYLQPLTQPGYLASVLYLGILCTLVTGALITYALRTLPAMSATIFGNFSTALSVVAGALILREPLYPYQLVCTLLIVIGVLGISLSTPPAKTETKGEENGN